MKHTTHKGEKTIAVDMRSAKSIKRAEAKQTLYQNRGYKYIRTEQVGLDLFYLIYGD